MIPESGLDVGWFLKLMKEWPKFVLFVYSFIKINWKLLQYKFQWEKGNIFCKTHWREERTKENERELFPRILFFSEHLCSIVVS